MASSQSSLHIPNHLEPSKPFVFITIPSALKLTPTNYLNWKLQLEAILVGHDLMGYINGDIQSPSPTILIEGVQTPNPAHATWLRQDKLLLGALLGTLSPNLISLVSTSTTSCELWTALAQQFAKSSRGHIKQKKDQMKHITKENKTITEYMQALKSCADELAALGKPMDPEDLIDRVLSNLDSSYDTLVESINSRDNPITFHELHEKLLNKELSLKLTAPPVFPSLPATAYAATTRPFFRPQRPPSGLLPTPPSPSHHHNKHPKPYLGKWQWCREPGHVVTQCPTFLAQCPNITPPDKPYYSHRKPTAPTPHAHAATVSNTLNVSPWLMDSGASHHITNDLNNLALHTPYDGTDELLIGDGKGLSISNVGSLSLAYPTAKLHLNNVLHVPTISRNIISISKFCQDNHATIKFSPSFFCVKDLATRKLLLQRPLHQGVYELPSSSPTACASNLSSSYLD